MMSRYLPYAGTPGRLTLQLVTDIVAVSWMTVWVLVGIAVHSAVARIGDVGLGVQNGANGVAGNLDSAGNGVHRVPWVGDVLSRPLIASGQAAQDIAAAGHNLHTTATWLAVLLALAVSTPPILAIAMPWLFLRLRFFRRKRTAIALAETPAGEHLLALRALANRPLTGLATVHPDPAGAWRREDVAVIRGLAALELRSAGVRRAHFGRTGR
ncbi:MAG TPA: hypothetical protein VMU34_25620 [Mycobacterium sp.]|nr:hypothetical protein [Mycobacterium sp.]